MLSEFLKALTEAMRKPSLEVFKGNPKATNGELPVAFVPDGYSPITFREELLRALPRPLQRSGKLDFSDLASMTAWINRHKDEDASALFGHANIRIGSLPNISLHAVIDYHEGGVEAPEASLSRARDCSFRAFYHFPLSEQMQAWLTVTNETNKVPLNQRDFSEFLDKRFDDIVAAPTVMEQVAGDQRSRVNITDPVIARLVSRPDTIIANPGEMLQLKRGIAVNVNRSVATEVDPNNGDINVVFEQTTTKVATKIKPPNLFLIAVPIFVGETQPTLMAVRLSVIPGEGTVAWRVGLHYPERIVENEFRNLAGAVAKNTNLPLFYSSPPVGRFDQ